MVKENSKQLIKDTEKKAFRILSCKVHVATSYNKITTVHKFNELPAKSCNHQPVPTRPTPDNTGSTSPFRAWACLKQFADD